MYKNIKYKKDITINMKIEITEFSYGYAVIEAIRFDSKWVEQIGIPPILIPETYLNIVEAPFLPSLIEEGQKLGYDAALKFDYLTLFLQFKLSDYMKKRSAKEVQENLIFPPYYRFRISKPIENRPRQHSLLYDLAEKNIFVYYAAPKFRFPSEFNNYYLTGQMLVNSLFIRPTDIGIFDDDDEHSVSFKDGSDVCILSKPKVLNIDPKHSHEIFFNDIQQHLKLKLRIKYVIPEMLDIISKSTNQTLINQTLQMIEQRTLRFRYQIEKDMFTITYLARMFFGCAVLFIPINDLKNEINQVTNAVTNQVKKDLIIF